MTTDEKEHRQSNKTLNAILYRNESVSCAILRTIAVDNVAPGLETLRIPHPGHAD